MTPSTDGGPAPRDDGLLHTRLPSELDDYTVSADSYCMPVTMYEFLSGGPLPEHLPPGFTLHENQGVPCVHWTGSFHAPETPENDA